MRDVTDGSDEMTEAAQAHNPSKRTASPRLAIGIPVYNGEKFMPAVLDSLAAQTFEDFEVVVCDNASSDRTFEVCTAYASRDPRIRVLRNERNLGAIANFNRVFESSCEAPLFKWMASDDLIHSRYLETCIGILDRHDDVVLAHSRTAFIDENGDEFPSDEASGDYRDPLTGVRQRPDSPAIGDSPIAVIRFWQVLDGARWGTHMFGVVRRPALVQAGLLPNFPSSDRAMLAELALLGRFKSSPEKLFYKRFHQKVSWALPLADLKEYLDTDSQAYSRRARQLRAYFGASRGKPIGSLSKAVCAAMVSVHCVRIGARTLGRKGTEEAAQGALWREKSRTRT